MKEVEFVCSTTVHVTSDKLWEGLTQTLGSGVPNVLESFHQPKHTAFHGRCLALPRPLGPTGKLALRAEADGLQPATLIPPLQFLYRSSVPSPCLETSISRRGRPVN